MPATLSYPGVYIEEIPSGVRTISGVSTSIAAFIGWAPKGPTDRAQRVLSWSDYERYFGGLDSRSLLGYSVYHFFANGGQDAYIVRLVQQNSPTAASGSSSSPSPTSASATPIPEPATSASVTIGPLTITAKNEGAWANKYGVAIKHQPDPSPSRFRLQVFYVDGLNKTLIESFENLSLNIINDRRSVDTVINSESGIIKIDVNRGSSAPSLVASDDNTEINLKMLGVGTGNTDGRDGDVLDPTLPNFRTALNPTSRIGGVYHLERIDLFNLLCVPGLSDPDALSSLQNFCRDHRAMLIADSSNAIQNVNSYGPATQLTGDDAINAAFYFPWVNAQDPLQENRIRAFPPCGFVAGIYAKTDANRGVWKAPAGIEASLSGVSGVKQSLTDKQNGILNLKAINCIRNFNVYGTVVWGARTLRGDQELGSEWKYIPVRRTALFIEESLYRGLKWVVFEPNDEPLWSQIRLNVGAFMQNLFRQSAFAGRTPREAYLVKCDRETTTQNDVNLGIVNIIVGFAPLKPAEFVIVKIQQLAGQIQV